MRNSKGTRARMNQCKSTKEFFGRRHEAGSFHRSLSGNSRGSMSLKYKRNSLPTLKNSRVVNIDFSSQPSDTINLIIKHPTSQSFKPSLACHQSQLTDFLQQVRSNLKRPALQMNKRKYIKVNQGNKNEMNHHQSAKMSKQEVYVPRQMGPCQIEMKNDYIRHSLEKQQRALGRGNSISPNQCHNLSMLTSPPDKYQSLRQMNGDMIFNLVANTTENNNPNLTQHNQNFEIVEQSAGRSHRSTLRSTVPNSNNNSHRIEEDGMHLQQQMAHQLIHQYKPPVVKPRQQQIQQQVYNKFKGMVADKIPSNKYSTKAKQSSKKLSQSKTKVGKRVMHNNGHKFSFANARSSLGLESQNKNPNEAQRVGDIYYEDQIQNQRYEVTNHHRDELIDQMSQSQLHLQNLEDRVYQNGGEKAGEVEYHNQVSSKNLTERNEINPLTTGRINKVESQQELRQYANQDIGFQPKNTPGNIYGDQMQSNQHLMLPQNKHQQSLEAGLLASSEYLKSRHPANMVQIADNTTDSISYVSGNATTSNRKVSLNLKDANNVQQVGHLRNMIRDEIARLESLYKNIDQMIQPPESSGSQSGQQVRNQSSAYGGVISPYNVFQAPTATKSHHTGSIDLTTGQSMKSIITSTSCAELGQRSKGILPQNYHLMRHPQPYPYHQPIQNAMRYQVRD